MGLLPKTSLRVTSGSILLGERDLLKLSNRAMRSVRGGDVAMVFQEPMTSLNPVMSIGAQLTEAIREHQGSDNAEAVALQMLDAVQITDPARRLKQFPHELSGGMRQRVMIAMALSCRPKVLIADEPTTALDVTVQAQILKLMRELKAEFGTSIILITHDMGVVAEMADRVVIMQHGRIVEEGPSLAIFNRPQDDYTQAVAGRRSAARSLGGNGWSAARDAAQDRAGALRSLACPERARAERELRQPCRPVLQGQGAGCRPFVTSRSISCRDKRSASSAKAVPASRRPARRFSGSFPSPAMC